MKIGRIPIHKTSQTKPWFIYQVKAKTSASLDETTTMTPPMNPAQNNWHQLADRQLQELTGLAIDSVCSEISTLSAEERSGGCLSAEPWAPSRWSPSDNGLQVSHFNSWASGGSDRRRVFHVLRVRNNVECRIVGMLAAWSRCFFVGDIVEFQRQCDSSWR